MQFDDRPQLPLTRTRQILVAVGVGMFLLQVAIAALIAEPTTGEGDASLAVFAGLWGLSVVWSTATALCVIRQADIPDVFTAAMIVTIAPFAVYALVAGLAVRGTSEETDIVSAMFFGITVGALTGLLVWAICMGVARAFKLPTTDGIEPPPHT